MSFNHHASKQPDFDHEIVKRFLDQMEGQAKRKYPAGRMGELDDGELAFAIAADRQHNTVVIRFGKAVEWIGLGPQDVKNLIDKLREKLVELSAGV